MTVKPKVAIMIATFNGVDWIDVQISSIMSLVDCEWHIYIRDDGSNDGTLNSLKNSCVPKENLTIIKADNYLAGSASRNFFKILDAIDCGEFEYLAFCDQDDIWFPEKIRESIKKIIDNGADAYSSNLIAFDNQSKKSWMLDKLSNQKKFDYLFQGASAGCTYVLTSKAAKIIKNVMGDYLRNFPKMFSHDWTIYAICRSHGLKWVHDDRSFIAYRQHSRNVFGAKPGLLGLIQKGRMSKDGWYKSHVLFLKKFLAGSHYEMKIIDAVGDLTMASKIFLIINVFSFRRKFKDAIYLGIAFLFGFF